MPQLTVDQALRIAHQHHQAGQLPQAEALYRQILQQDPNHSEALHLLGVIAYQAGRHDLAVELIRRAIALQPNYPGSHSNLGAALKDLGQLDAAIAAYRQALALNPGFAEAYSNLAIALQAKWQLDEAAAACRQALALNPHLAEAHHNLGDALKAQGQIGAAIAAYRQAVALAPDNARMHSDLVYGMYFDPSATPAMMREELGRWNARHGAALSSEIQPHRNSADPNRRLKIGYASPDFFLQAEAFFVVPLLEAHDHRPFEIHAYASVRHPDEITTRLQRSADQWRDVRALSDAALAAQIRADGIDILVDLTMHMGHNRLGVFARKPAPVQAAWLAYPGSTGLSAMDYRLTDAWMDPPGPSDAHYSEASLRLPHSWCCFHPLTDTPAAGPLPALTRGHVTFGSLNNPCKHNPLVFALWARVLNRVADAHLLLRSPEGGHRKVILDFFSGRGIAPQRIEFVPHQPRPDYLQQYDRIDIALDPFPYNGITTTCDALWMGVPVLSYPGVMAPSRAGLSLLKNAGLAELLAATEGPFVELGVALAGDLPRLANLRATLRQRMAQSPLMDAPRFARDLEAVYRQMWRQWCATASSARTA